MRRDLAREMRYDASADLDNVTSRCWILPSFSAPSRIVLMTSVWIVKLEKHRSLNRSASVVPGTGFKPETTMFEERLFCVLSSE